MIRTCLTRDFSDFVNAHPIPLKMPRGDRELTISWQNLQELVSTVHGVTSSFSGGVQIRLPKEPSVILVLFSGSYPFNKYVDKDERDSHIFKESTDQ